MKVEFIVAISGGVIGALVTYSLTRGSEIGNRVYERQRRSFSALVKLEYLSCQNMNSISDCIYVIDDFIDTAEEPLK